MWIAPALSYVFAGADWYSGGVMAVPAGFYFTLAIPCTVAFNLALSIPAGVAHTFSGSNDRAWGWLLLVTGLADSTGAGTGGYPGRVATSAVSHGAVVAGGVAVAAGVPAPAVAAVRCGCVVSAVRCAAHHPVRLSDGVVVVVVVLHAPAGGSAFEIPFVRSSLAGTGGFVCFVVQIRVPAKDLVRTLHRTALADLFIARRAAPPASCRSAAPRHRPTLHRPAQPGLSYTLTMAYVRARRALCPRRHLAGRPARSPAAPVPRAPANDRQAVRRTSAVSPE